MRHPNIIKNESALVWSFNANLIDLDEIKRFSLMEDVEVNTGPTNSVSGFSSAWAERGVVFTVSGLPWADPEANYTIRVPNAIADAINLLVDGVATRDEGIRVARSADLPARVGDLRSMGIPVLSHRITVEDTNSNLVRKFIAYELMVYIEQGATEDSQPLWPLLAQDEFYLRQLQFVEARHQQELALLQQNHQRNLAALWAAKEEGRI